ncbi:MAG: ABC transporter permease [Caulobacterales bacterium]
MGGAVLDLWRGVVRWRDWSKMAIQDIDLRYRRSLFGPFWISASVVALILSLAYLYSAIFKQPFETYLPYLAFGYMAWALILGVVSDSATSALEHEGYLRNLPLPLSFIAGRIALRNAIIFLHNLVAVSVILYLFGHRYEVVALQVLLGAWLIIAIGYCAVLILGPVCARFRDVQQLVMSAMQLVFFLTPIFWMPEHAGPRSVFVEANPFYHLIELVRAPMLGAPADLRHWIFSFWILGAAFVMALVSVSLTRRRVALWI